MTDIEYLGKYYAAWPDPGWEKPERKDPDPPTLDEILGLE